jgi:hypothetical protein
MKSGCVHVVAVDTNLCREQWRLNFFLGDTLTSYVKVSSPKARAMARSSQIINWLKVSPSRRTSLARQLDPPVAVATQPPGSQNDASPAMLSA